MNALVRTLFVSHYFPDMPDQMVHGAFQRVRRHVDALSSIGPVDFVFLWPLHWFESEEHKKAAPEAFRRLWSIAGRIVFIAPPPLPERFRRWPRDLAPGDILAAARGAVSFSEGWPTRRSSRKAELRRLEQVIGDFKPDLIFAHRLAASAALIRATGPLPPVLVDFDDLEHITLQREMGIERSLPARLRLALSARLARRTERLVAGFASAALVCSEHDRRILRRLAPAARIELAPNAAAATAASPLPAAPTALFVGYARYAPNAEAIVWLVRKIFPLVRARLPQARLVIVGDGSRELGIGDDEPGVEIQGFVPDLGLAYAQARLVVCPIRRGGGTRIKIIEAALYGRPVVSTATGAEGLDLVDGRDLVLADEEEAFAAAMLDLMSDDKKAARIGAMAAEQAGRLYGAEKVRRDLARLAFSLARPCSAPAGGS